MYLDRPPKYTNEINIENVFMYRPKSAKIGLKHQ
jgi:hypothetical protein